MQACMSADQEQNLRTEICFSSFKMQFFDVVWGWQSIVVTVKNKVSLPGIELHKVGLPLK